MGVAEGLLVVGGREGPTEGSRVLCLPAMMGDGTGVGWICG